MACGGTQNTELKRPKLHGAEATMWETLACLVKLPDSDKARLGEATLLTPADVEVALVPQKHSLCATTRHQTLTAAGLLCSQSRKLSVAVLNFANSFNCGGGFEHCGGSQEECLFRYSTLALSLWPHRREGDGAGVLTRGQWIGQFDPPVLPRLEPFYPLPAVSVVYSPCVFTLRDPRRKEVLFPREEWKQEYACISAAAQDLHREQWNRALTRDKFVHILATCAAKGHNALVLGAIGCGYFRNPTSEVAEIFHELLTTQFRDVFRVVLFAVPDSKATQFAQYFPMMSDDEVNAFLRESS